MRNDLAFNHLNNKMDQITIVNLFMNIRDVGLHRASQSEESRGGGGSRQNEALQVEIGFFLDIPTRHLTSFWS